MPVQSVRSDTAQSWRASTGLRAALCCAADTLLGSWPRLEGLSDARYASRVYQRQNQEDLQDALYWRHMTLHLQCCHSLALFRVVMWAAQIAEVAGNSMRHQGGPRWAMGQQLICCRVSPARLARRADLKEGSGVP